ncbi:putative nucleolar MIF4G domain-containing protein 1-like [Trypanosoma grayi]|uniref:putative nucleolar MIF4G domain-containing protein 1-like n=1 Tax=Trypanosoma grayi TaxID=71804 RepID=UPI0004F4A3D9|nr:putative nucleolar MIF4G domain-containing protein 1-like [Trypanosoma grayi]KEG09814.1 putative nucleolar MIF4G domain-containing protein 1-like [Trypanosoma grayi]
MELNRRRRAREEVENDEGDKQQGRKQRRRSERQARKQARIEAHERWVEQRRLLREGVNGQRVKKQHTRQPTDFSADAPVSAAPMKEGGKVRTTGDSRAPHTLKKDKSKRKREKDAAKKKKNGNEVSERSGADPSRELTGKTNETEITPAKYLPPTLRGKVTQERGTALNEVTRRIINKLTVRNVADMTKEASDLFGGGVEGATRASVLCSLAHHINRICMLDAGPLTPIVSLPFAGLIRGMQLLHGNVVGAELVESLSLALQEHLQNDNETAVSNGAMVLAHLYVLNAVDSVLVSSFLRSVLRIGSSGNVCAVAGGLTLLRACGEKLLKEAPGQMERALAEAKAYGREQQGTNRYTALLGYITDIVRGHTRSAKRTVGEEEVPIESILNDMVTLLPGGSSSSGGGTSTNRRALLRITTTTNVLSGVTWERMIRKDKPPRWFAPGAWDKAEMEESEEDRDGTSSQEEEAASSSSFSTDSETESEDDETELKAERIRQLREQEKAISGQRLNTENKREVFQCIVNASDDLEAFTLLMHRDPSFSRLHDTLTVLLQCCYQEKVYNPYYTQVIQRFCSAKGSCRNSLQFALWDMFKVIRMESVDVTGYLNLSCLLTQLIEGGVFTLGVLRGLDMDSTNRTIGLFTRILLLRLILQLPAAKLTEVFFGGDGFRAHDVKIDTGVLRSNLAKLMERYFVDERESQKWIPHFYDVVAAGTPFDVHRRGKNAESDDDKPKGEEEQLQLFVKRIRVVFKALKSGIS